MKSGQGHAEDREGSRQACTRRRFLGSMALGTASVAVFSRVSLGKSAADRPFTFVQLCDPQLGMGGYEQDLANLRQAVAQIDRLQPGFVVVCGDLVHDAKASSFADFREAMAGLTVPWYCAPGNHDVGGTPTLASLQRFREAMGNDKASMEYGGYVFVFVNTQLWKAPVEGETERHDAWLERTLDAAAKRDAGIFIIGHYPLFLEDPDEAEAYMNLPVAKRKALLRRFRTTGVLAVLGGHVHRLLINDFEGIQLVNGETTSKNFDQRPFGYRVWHVEGAPPFRHEFVPVDGHGKESE